ncbi:MAG: DegT/DnrJ/EryC1/StrS family aminotransferase [Lentisphaerae bacterium]|nr:DegT/DnrJ/EryC1/StrS family aminotransferase [Lentisphaerota bacterium]
MHIVSKGKPTRIVNFGRPFLNEKEVQAVSEVLLSGWLTHGPKTEAFEQNFSKMIGINHAVAVSSCTAALHLGLMSHDIGPSDEVIVPAQTHVATAHAVEFCGATPVFADVDPITANVTAETISRVLTKKTRAVQLVHFAGYPCEMDEIQALCKANHILLFEDCAHAVGSYYKDQPVGTFGNGGSFSFYPIKHMTTIEGGMFITSQDDIAHRVRISRAFGIDTPPHKRKKPGFYDVTTLGYNYRMTEVEAAIGLVQLNKLPEIIKHRRHVARLYTEGLKQNDYFQLPPESPHSAHGFFVYNVLVNSKTSADRDTCLQYLKSQGIGTSIYYATPVPLMSYYRNKYGFKEGDFPNAEHIADKSVAIPMGLHLSDDDVEYVIDKMKKWATERAGK